VRSEQELQAIIARSPWFADLPEEAHRQLASAASTRFLPVNSYIYQQGRPTTEIYGLLSGRVRITISSPNGQEFALVDHEPDTWLGQPALLGDEGRVIDARVIESSEVLVIPREVVLAVGNTYPLLYRNLFRYTQDVLRGFHELMAGILFYPLKSRVAGRLLELAREHGETVSEGVQLDVKVSQNDFARLALGSRQRVNKIFREWNSRGLVVTRDDRLLIRDVNELEQEIDLFE
jgi:CRP-like cAMP-binding protein